MIRTAHKSDLSDLLLMGKRFFKASPWAEIAEWDSVSFAETLELLLSDESAAGVVVAEEEGSMVGMVGYLTFPLYCNHDITMAQEIFLWVNPDHRNGIGAELLAAAEEMSRAHGAQFFMSASLAGMRDEALARFYERRGYRPMEHTFSKALMQ